MEIYLFYTDKQLGTYVGQVFGDTEHEEKIRFSHELERARTLLWPEDKDTIEGLRHELENYHNDLETKQVRLLTQADEIAKLNEIIRDLENTLKEHVKDSDGEIARLNEIIRELEKTDRACDTDLKDERKKSDTLVSLLKAQEDEYAKSNEIIHTQADEIAKMNEIIRELEKNNRACDTDLQELQHDLDTSARHVATVTTEKAQLNEQLNDLQRKLDDTTIQVTSLVRERDNTVTHFNDKFEELHRETNRLIKDRDNCKKRVKDIETVNNELHEQIKANTVQRQRWKS